MGIWRGGGRLKHSALIPSRATGARRHGHRRERRDFQKKYLSQFCLIIFVKNESKTATEDSKNALKRLRECTIKRVVFERLGA